MTQYPVGPSAYVYISPLSMSEMRTSPDVYAVFRLCYPFARWNKGKEEHVELSRGGPRAERNSARLEE